VEQVRTGRPSHGGAPFLKRILNAVSGRLGIILLRWIRRARPERAAGFVGRLVPYVSPWLPEHRIGRANLTAAFPEKSPGEIDAILRGAWSNLAQVGVEYAHLDRLWDYDPGRPGRIEVDPETARRLSAIREEGKGAYFFTGHTGNWELTAVGLAASGLDILVLYRQPNNREVDEAIRKLRADSMGTLVPTNAEAGFKLMKGLARGQSVAMAVDQHFGQGVDITFFGRPCKANATLARLARRVERPIYGMRIVRLPNHRFRFEVTPELVPARDDAGKLNVDATTQQINSVIEGWVREYPEQWLWLHRRWR
jgi:Kdo2-lipid IVA lauroyltransferase/acyltransferase